MSAEPHPTGGLDDTVHQRVRLGLLSVLMEVGRADFSYLKRSLELSDGNLNRHLEVLATERLVSVTKESDGGRARTWVAITPRGRRALAAEMEQLAELVRRFEAVRAPARPPRRRTRPTGLTAPG